MSLNESIVEAAALEWFGELGYAVAVSYTHLDVYKRQVAVSYAKTILPSRHSGESRNPAPSSDIH